MLPIPPRKNTPCIALVIACSSILRVGKGNKDMDEMSGEGSFVLAALCEASALEREDEDRKGSKEEMREIDPGNQNEAGDESANASSRKTGPRADPERGKDLGSESVID